MAKIKKKNILLEGLSGSIGDLVFRQMPDGSTRVSQKPDFSERVSQPGANRPPGPHQAGFGVCERGQKPGPSTSSALPAARQPERLQPGVADWFHPPVIHGIERDGRVRVEASDNMQVTKVEVRILDGEGKVLEQGQAEQVNPLYWEYAPSAEGTVEASAWDLAGKRDGRGL
jgi:hypothetical protein